MNYKIVNGSVSYGADTILEEINFEIRNKEKIAIVGRNGSGKSTLLKAIIDNELLSEGIGTEKFNIYKEGNPSIGYLKQIEFENDQITMLDEILKVYSEIISVENKIEQLVARMQENPSEELAKEYSKLQDRYELLDGYTYKKEYETAIRKFGFSKEDKLKKISEFSGGQRTKIAFIKLLLSKPDILLLDEPTNHLDIVAIEWLESYLKNYPNAVVIVSHDRMFLNKIVDKIYEIEYGAMTKYSGDYEFFEKQKRINYEKQLKDYEYQQKEIKRLNDIADRFRYKPTKAKMALSKLKQIERMVKVEEPNKYDLKTFKTNFTLSKETGNFILRAEDLEIGYNCQKIAKINFELYRGQKLGIIGGNGTGKSTLLKTIMRMQEPISGKIELGHNIEIGYFDQRMAEINSNKTIYDDFSEDFPKLTVTEVRNSLAAFMFSGDDVFKEINMLSGGEKVRLALCKILKKGPNVLILDEPTNHMDVIGRETLENMLQEYKGTIIFVSHDRFFVKKMADSILAFEKGEQMIDTKTMAKKIKQEGGNLYLVGGAVRDSLLGKQTHDEDYCVTGIEFEKFQQLFPKANIRGKAFAVFDIDGKEFALARTEAKIGTGHKEFEINADSKISIEEDLARRDITINSMAKDVLTEEIIDPFNGQRDLENKIIRATTQHFKEDPLRVYRVARFAAQLEFKVEQETIKQMNELKSELDTLSKERIFTELSKALEAEKPSIFFEVLRKAEVLDIHFNEIKDLIGAEQPVNYHPEGDAYNHTMLVLDMASDMTKNFEKNRKLEIRFSALVHDLGKGLTPKEEYPHHYGHENTGVELVSKLGNKISAPNNWIKCGKTSCKEHMRGGIFYKMKPAKMVDFIERVDKTLLGLDGLQIVVISDKTSGGRPTEKEYINFEELGRTCFSEINGEYIKNKYGLEPGKEFGNKLHEERIKWMQNYIAKEKIEKK